MDFNTHVGPLNSADGSNPIARSDQQGAVVVSPLHAKYYEDNFRGNIFSACTTSAATIGVLTATGVSYHLYNPLASQKNLVILAANFGPTSATFAVGTVFYAFNQQTAAPTGTTPLTVRSNLLTGNPAGSVAQVFSAATLASAPVAVRPWFAAPATALTSLSNVKDEVAGEIIVAPGGVLSIQASVAACAVGHIGLSWAEIPAWA
jgi:hypothetical protein